MKRAKRTVEQIQADIAQTKTKLNRLAAEIVEAVLTEAQPAGYVVGTAYRDRGSSFPGSWTVVALHCGNAWAVSERGSYGVLLADQIGRYEEDR